MKQIKIITHLGNPQIKSDVPIDKNVVLDKVQ